MSPTASAEAPEVRGGRPRDAGGGYRSGFAALLGRPNVGKSTLLNALVGAKVAITSPKPQTTRNRILGVRHFPGGQVVFVDTPGLHRPRDLLGEQMVRAARSSLAGIDLACLVVDLGAAPGPGDRRAAQVVLGADRPVALVGTKADLVKRPAERLAEHHAALEEAAREGRGDGAGAPAFVAAFAVSGLTGAGLPDLADWIESRMPEGPPYFPEGQVTDQPEERVVAELVREQVLARVGEEVPYGVAVVVARMEPRPNGLVYVEALLFVERDSHRGILIGKGGSMLKSIGQAARAEIEAVLGSRVYLDLHVKVKPNWRDRPGALAELQPDG